MACPQVITGDQFLQRLLSHIDCQAQLIGSYGYQSLGEPGSLASTIIASLLTLFIALFGVRLLFPPNPAARDTVSDVIKIGIVLALSFSWPAFRTVIYDVALLGPGEIAAALNSPSLPQLGAGFAERLQAADNGILRLIEAGTGRNTGAFVNGDAPGGTFTAAALDDENTLGLARLAYLAGIVGTLALLRVAAGLLLALAPLAAGLLLFEQTRGVFSGWLRGIVLTMIGSLGVTVILAVQLAILEPWLVDALRVRSLGYAIPAAPTELLAITLGFAIAQLAMIWLLARVAFTRGWVSIPALTLSDRTEGPRPAALLPQRAAEAGRPSRAERISQSVETTLRREDSGYSGRSVASSSFADKSRSAEPAEHGGSTTAAQSRLGSSYRRSRHRSSMAANRRDST